MAKTNKKPPKGKVKKLLSNSASLIRNTMVTRSTLLQHLLDGTVRDIDHECHYPTDISISQYKLLYDREGIARRVVNCLPEESWSQDPDVYDTEEADETEFEGQWKELVRDHNLLHYLYRIDELSGVGRFGVLLLGIDDGKLLSDPVDGINERGEKAGNSEYKLLYLRCFDESVTEITTRQMDKSNPRYGMPLTYTIRFQDIDSADSAETLTQIVHWSRVIHVADNRMMSEVYGTPRMKSVYNRIYDIRKVLSGSGEMYWKGAFPGFAFEVHPDQIAAGAEIDTTAMREEFQNYSEGLQRYLALKGVTTKALSPQVADPTGHVNIQLKAIAISLSIPHRILFGSEQAQLASSQDARSWHSRIYRRQTKYIDPMILRPLIDRLIAFGILIEPEEYYISWPDLGSPTEADKAQVALVRTDALSKYVAGSVDHLIPPDLYLTQIVGMEPEEVEEIMKSAEEYAGEQEPEEVLEPPIPPPIVPVPEMPPTDEEEQA